MGELCLNKDNLALIDLDKLPGGRELYEHLTDVFLKAYLEQSLKESEE